jgi:photosystem II stability/assembly factor-like uncharacterized protein
VDQKVVIKIVCIGLVVFLCSCLFKEESFGKFEVESVKTIPVKSSSQNSLYFVNRDTGFIMGDRQTLLRTVNGGLDWTSITLDSDCGFNTMRFNNYGKGYLLGCGGNLHETTDWGKTWNKLSLLFFKSHDTFYDLEFRGKDTCYIICGSAEDQNYVLKTMDNGKTWSQLIIPDMCFSISFSNDTSSYVCGHMGVLKTSNSWRTFTKISNNPLQNITAINDTLLFGSYYRRLYMSTNGGRNWIELKKFKNYGIGENFNTISNILPLHNNYFFLLENRLFKTDLSGNISAFELGDGNYVDFQIINATTLYLIDKNGRFVIVNL